MGEVYRARDTRLGREVAVKVLPVAASDGEMESRLRREARSIASLPHIGALYDVGKEAGIPLSPPTSLAFGSLVPLSSV
jgi:serine/threonine protein kinase